MKDFFNGKWGLAWTYWAGVVGFSLLLQALAKYFSYKFLTLEAGAAYERLDLIHTVTICVAVVIMALLARAMVKAGFDNRTPGFWGWLGIGIASLRTCHLGLAALTLVIPSIGTPLYMVRMELKELNKQSPP